MPRVSMASNTPSVYRPSVDVLALHYDCSPDPDDLLSCPADRALLESRFGRAWVASHVLAVIGTYGGGNGRVSWFKEGPCERVAQAVWGEVGGYLRAGLPLAGVGGAKSAELRGLHTEAVAHAARRWRHALEGGGQVYVKEGGQSDFTAAVVRVLEAWRAGSGRCVHIVQHAGWNEDQNSAGVTAYLQANADYLGPITRGSGPITDGNLYMAAVRGAYNSAFVRAALGSWMGCAWSVAFHEFQSCPFACYGHCWREGAPMHEPGRNVSECLDFSDTHELAFILGVAPTTIAQFTAAYLEPSAPSNAAASAAGPLPPPADCTRPRPGSRLEQPLWLTMEPPSLPTPRTPPPPTPPPTPPQPPTPTPPLLPPPRPPELSSQPTAVFVTLAHVPSINVILGGFLLLVCGAVAACSALRRRQQKRREWRMRNGYRMVRACCRRCLLAHSHAPVLTQCPSRRFTHCTCSRRYACRLSLRRLKARPSHRSSLLARSLCPLRSRARCYPPRPRPETRS